MRRVGPKGRRVRRVEFDVGKAWGNVRPPSPAAT